MVILLHKQLKYKPMALAKKDKAKKPVKVEKVRYGLNLGEMVRTAVDTHPTLTQNEIGKLINLGRQGVYHRMHNPTYGTGYDIIEISLLLKKDFVTPMLQVIQNHGIYPEKSYNQEEFDEMAKQVQHYKELYERASREIDLLHKIVDKKKI